jgi:hypothetical protein
MVTGGFRTRLGIENAISRGDCDMAGLARPAVMNPALPSDVIFNENVSDEDAKFPIHKVEPSPWLDWLGLRSVGAGAASVSSSLIRIRSSRADTPVEMVR